jgi:HD-GYP domain-containing protein (c-di-GMP phosphodiesterase class II)
MSEDKAQAGARRVVLLLAEDPLALEIERALDGVSAEVHVATDPARVAEVAGADDLVIARLDSVALTPAAPRPEAPGQVRARTPKPFAKNTLYAEAREYVEETLTLVREGGDPDVDRGRVIAERMHTDLLRDNVLINRSLEPHDSYDLASHSVNVAIIGGKLALGMVSGVEDVVQVIHAGLVHDIGMARLPETLLGNRGAWSDRELEALRKHPILGAEIIERCAPRNEWLKRAVLQEHERARGQGYPYGLYDRDLDPVARILGVADVFEALSHPRSYRSPFTALEALERVVGMQEEYFSPQVVSALVNEISAFPLDSYVQISSGEIGRVVATDPSNILRPKVELVWDANWNPVTESDTLDLATRPDLTVARALLDAELPLT